MDNQMEKKISTSEVVNHLRKMHREYKFYEHALDIANALDQAEKSLSSSKKECVDLEEYKKTLNNDLDFAERKLEEVNKQADSTKAEISTMIKSAKQKAEEITAKAISDAESTESAANERIESLHSKIDFLNIEIVELQEAKASAEAQLDEINNKIKETKQKLIDSL